MKPIKPLISLFFISLIMACSSANAGGAMSGTIACGGNHVIRNGGNEFQLTQFVLRNYNQTNSIRLDRIRFYNATGSLILDFDGSALPKFINGVLGPMDNQLEPFQTALLRSFDIFADSSLGKKQRPIQVWFDWSADVRVKGPKITIVRQARERIEIIDPTTGLNTVKLGAERSRHRSPCHKVH